MTESLNLPKENISNDEIRRKAEEVYKLLHENYYTPDSDRVAYESAGGHVLSRIPVKKYTDDERADDLAYYKILREEAGGEVFDKLEPDKYIDLVRQKHKEREALEWEKFLLDSFKSDDPYAMSRLQELFPEIIESRLKTIDERADIYLKLARITTRGARTREDWALLWQLQNGDLPFDPNVLSSLFGLSEAQQREAAVAFNRGFLNPRRRKGLYDQIEVQEVDPWKPIMLTDTGDVALKPRKGLATVRERNLTRQPFKDIFQDALRNFLGVQAQQQPAAQQGGP